MNTTTKWIVGLIILVVVAYGGYRVIKHFMRVAAPAPVATMTPATSTPIPTETPIPTATPKPTKTPRPTPTPKVNININY